MRSNLGHRVTYMLGLPFSLLMTEGETEGSPQTEPMEEATPSSVQDAIDRLRTADGEAVTELHPNLLRMRCVRLCLQESSFLAQKHPACCVDAVLP